MKLLIVGNFHHKNQIGLKILLEYLNWQYTFAGDNNINQCDINEFDIIYSPKKPIDTSKYPTKKFIFGPHFSVFPTSQLTHINNIHKNSIYIHPSPWSRDVWKNKNAEIYLPIKSFPFPVDTENFTPIDNPAETKNKIFIYFKRRNPNELSFIKKYLNNKNIEYRVFNYSQRYNENDYLNYLKECRYGIWVGCHESQGFALEEALSCNVPLLVWNTQYMCQEYGTNYEKIPCTTISYWDERCGEYFYQQGEFENKYDEFLSKLDTYQPRQYILDDFSLKKCAERWNKLISDI